MNENQKKVTETYRSNWDSIFGKKKEPVKQHVRDYKAECKTLADSMFDSVINTNVTNKS